MKAHQVIVLLAGSLCACSGSQNDKVPERALLDRAIAASVSVPFSAFDTLFINQPVRYAPEAVLPEDEIPDTWYVADLLGDTCRQILENKISRPVIPLSVRNEGACPAVKEAIPPNASKGTVKPVFLSAAGTIHARDTVRINEIYKYGDTAISMQKVFCYDGSSWNCRITGTSGWRLK